jgi:hypothetical protein
MSGFEACAGFKLMLSLVVSKITFVTNNKFVFYVVKLW